MVVHRDHQNQLVGSQMLKSIWGDSHDYAWGIASANPFAIRALEKATRRRCTPAHMLKHRGPIETILRKIPYLEGKPIKLAELQSSIDTNFNQDLSEVTYRRELASTREAWTMGNIFEGEEWLAITFNNQTQIEWTDEEFERFIKMSGNIVQQAYERMSAQSPQENHPWASPDKAAREVEFLIKAMDLQEGSSIIDFGCGAGRHSNALAERNFVVTGVDFSPTAIARARADANAAAPARFIQADCRDVKVEGTFSAGICLYDVIGSFPDDASNQRILKNLVSHLVSGAMVAFSVMSFDYIESRAIHKVGNGNVQRRLNELRASDSMQRDGEIFGPENILLDTKNRLVYRREIFDQGANLRTEEIVRDRRYTFGDLVEMCEAVGLSMQAIGFVRAGRFELINTPPAEPTKEILVIARKSLV
jgi:2-polyprenyl-3-methyl-5-hydroxy-6-metoxy-1,4-benzoquinol methylase